MILPLLGMLALIPAGCQSQIDDAPPEDEAAGPPGPFAKSSSSSSKSSCSDGKSNVCHQGQTLCVSNSAVSSHQAHGDKLCACESIKSFFADADADRFGDAASPVSECSAPAGYVADKTDCNDANAAINPKAKEVCNGIDDDCDGKIDEDTTGTYSYYRDEDGDGYGDPEEDPKRSCSAAPPAGYSADGTDCDDEDAAVNPAAAEVCNGRDDDCDGQKDEGLLTTFYRDDDRDGFGTAKEDPKQSCSTTPPSGYVANSEDCDDEDAAVNPAASEVCNSIDDDCDGQIDEDLQATFYPDADGDGFGASSAEPKRACGTTAPAGYARSNTDCDDTNAAVNPAAAEVCNGIDDDCDALADDADSPVLGQRHFSRDLDGDGFGASSSGTLLTCAATAPTGYANSDTDCDDADAAVNPVAPEVCNGIDDDCNALADDADPGVTNRNTYHRDLDGDGFGASSSGTTQTCAATAPTGYAASDVDCDDGSAAVNPGAQEVCNSIDDDCDGEIDDSDASITGQRTYFADADGDGNGSPEGATVQTCAATPPAGFSADALDCDDASAAVHPGAEEVCNGLDDDCDAQLDDDDALVTGQATYYQDNDQDGYGRSSSGTLRSCASTAPAGYSAADTDCDDANASIHPGAAELACNGIDDDCDPATGDGGSGSSQIFYEDRDGDGYGSPGSGQGGCGGAPAGYVTADGDCDDNDAAIHPGAAEVCDGKDDNCDGQGDRVTDIAAGLEHSLALCSDGTVRAWGYNGDGQLGDGSDVYNRNAPVSVEILTGVMAIAGGCYHSLALRDDGTVWAWGYNGDGELGDGSMDYFRATPGQVAGLDHVVAISAGCSHSVALRDDGTVWTWGYNGYGELGDGSWDFFRGLPGQVDTLGGIVAISAGGDHTLALHGDGTIWAWGYNYDGELGDGTDMFYQGLPVQTVGIDHVVAISGGGVHSLALRDDGTVWAWGYNYDGELGDGSGLDFRNVPGPVPALEGAVAIAAGGLHSRALTYDGTILAWGDNAYGELGDGTDGNYYDTPVVIETLTDAIDLAGGYLHGLTLNGEGAVHASGWNQYGQLGDGTTEDRPHPVRVLNLP